MDREGKANLHPGMESLSKSESWVLGQDAEEDGGSAAEGEGGHQGL